MKRFLGTTHVVSPSSGFGMGYLPADARNDWLNRMNPRPLLHVLLGALGLSNSQPATSTSKLRSLVGTVFDQGNTGACTAESVCKAVRVTQLARGLALPAGCDDYSPDVMYKQTRAIEVGASYTGSGSLGLLTDSGCMPDDCITSIANLGLKGMPSGTMTQDGRYNDTELGSINTRVSLKDEEMTSLYLGAHDVNIRATDLDVQLQTQCNANIGGTFALFVDTQNFMGWTGGDPIQSIDLNDPQGGGHQICGPVDYEVSSSLGLIWVFGNSWGPSWGENGFGRITHKCLVTTLDAALAFDVKEAA